jgi:hypothetical protein
LGFLREILTRHGFLRVEGVMRATGEARRLLFGHLQERCVNAVDRRDEGAGMIER